MSKAPAAHHLRQPGKEKQRPSAAKAKSVSRLPYRLSQAIMMLACVAVFIPLVVNSDFYYPYIFLKSILFRVAVQVMAFLYVLLAVICPAYRPRINRIVTAFLVYFGIMLVSSLPGISASAWTSWWGDFSRMGGMISQLHLLAFFFVLSQTLKREREWMALLAASLFSGVLMGLTGLMQYLGLDYLYGGTLVDRIRGTAGNSDFFALLMVLNFFIVLWFLSRNDKAEAYALAAKAWFVLLISSDIFLLVWSIAAGGSPAFLTTGSRAFPIAVFALILHGLVLAWFFARRSVLVGSALLCLFGLYFLYWMILSQTRFAVIGLVGSLIFVSVLYLVAGANRRLKWVTAALLLCVCLVPTYVWLKRRSSWVQGNPALSRLTSLTYADAVPRLLAWKAASLSILHRPLLGWGLENNQNAFDFHFPARLFESLESETWYDRAHNFLLDIGATTGLLGLAAYLTFYGLLFAFLLGRWWRTREASNSLMLAGFFAAYLLQDLFIFDTINTDVIIFPLLAYVAFLYQTDKSGKAAAESPQPTQVSVKWMDWLAMAAGAAILVSAGWLTVKRPYDSNLLLSQGIALEKGLDLRTRATRYVFRDDLVESFQAASDFQTEGRYEVREEFANYASELAKEAPVPLAAKAGVVKRALAMLEESVRQDSDFAKRYMYPVSLVNRTFGILKESDPVLARSWAEKSLEFLRRAGSLAPTRPQVFLEKAQTLSSLGRYDEAAASLETAISLSPEVKSPYTDLATMYASAGRCDDAARQWQKMKSLSIAPGVADYDRLINCYNSKKQFPQAVALFKQRLAMAPDAVVMARLAATYRDMGDGEAARQTAQKAASLSPQVAAGLQDFLNTLLKPK